MARADGRGAQKFTRTIAAGKLVDLTVTMPANRASRPNGATITGEGVNQRAPDRRHGGDQLGRRRARARRRGDRGHRRPRRRRAARRPRAGERAPAGRRRRRRPGRPGRAEPLHGAAAVRDPHLLGATCADDGDFDSDLHEPGRRLPRRRAAAAGAGHDPARLRRAGHAGDARAPARAHQPVHGQPDLLGVEQRARERSGLRRRTARLGSAATPRRDQDVRAAELQVFSRPAEVTTTERPRPTGGGAPTPTGAGTAPRARPRPAAPAAPARAGCLRLAPPASAPSGAAARPRAADRVRPPGRQPGQRRRLPAVARAPGDRQPARRALPAARQRPSPGTGRRAQRQAAHRRRATSCASGCPRAPGGATSAGSRSRARGGRFRVRPPFYGRSSCGLVTSYKLSSAVFGGRQGRRLGIAFRLSRRATVRLDGHARGARTVRRFRARGLRARAHAPALAAGRPAARAATTA